MSQIFILPVSGGYFPLQIAQLLWMHVTPSIVVGSSGGNIAGYLSTAGGWSEEGIQTVIDKMYSSLFIKSWWPEYLPYLPSVLKGYFKGSAYDSNTAFIEIFKEFFSTPLGSTTLASTEHWTGTYNTTLGATQLFCSRSEDNALLHPGAHNNTLLNVVSPIYTAGDIITLAQACFASASVPAVFPPQHIMGSYYIDGGTAYSSPLTVLKESLQTVVNKGAHLTYFSPYDIQSPAFTVCYEPGMKASTLGTECVPGTMYNQGVDAVSEILKSLMLQDRMAGVSLIGDPALLIYTEYIMSHDEFKDLQEKRKDYPRTFVEVYPLSKEHISIIYFTPDDIRRVIASVTQIGVRMWALPLPTPNLTEPLPD